MKTKKQRRALALALRSAAGTVLFASAVSASTLTWDSAGTTPTNPTDGPGTWSLSDADWSNGTTDAVWPNDTTVAVFGNNDGTAGTVNVTTPITTGGITFNSPTSGNYNLSGNNNITLSGIGPTITVNGTVSPIISVPLAGSGGLIVAGTGTLNLDVDNNYSGETNVSNGKLVLGSGSALGSGILVVGTSGRVDVNASITTSYSAVNSGNFTVAAGKCFNISTGSFNQSAGTLTINGSLNLFNDNTFIDGGGTIIGTVVFLNAGTVDFGPAASGTFAFNANNSGSQVAVVAGVTGGMNIPSGVAVSAIDTNGGTYLNVENAAGNYGNLTLTAANGYFGELEIPTNFTNHGTITLASAGAGSVLSITPGGTTIINAADGTLKINASTNASGSVVNSGSFTIAAGQFFNMSYGTFNQAAGTLAINGSLNLTNATTFIDTAGTITGTVALLSGGTVEFGPGATGTFSFNANSSSSQVAMVTGVTGGMNIPSGITVSAINLDGGTYLNVENAAGNYGNLTLTAANGYFGELEIPTNFTNHGTITLASAGAGSVLSITPGGTTIINAADGTLKINASTNASGNVVNTGSFTIAAGQFLNMSSGTFNQAAGTLVVNGSLNLTNSLTFIDTGGTITGTVGFNGGGTLEFGSAAAGTFAFNANSSTAQSGHVQGVTSGLNVPSGVTVSAINTGGGTYLYLQNVPINYGNVSLTAANGYFGELEISSGLINHGNITLASVGTPSALTINNGFTNATDGTINIDGPTTASNSVVNSGSFNVAAGQYFNISSGGFNQAGGTLTVNGNLGIPHLGTFTQSGGETNFAAGSNLSLPSSGQFLISGGTLSLAPSGTAPATLSIVSLAWPNPSVAMNPATDLAFISTLPVSGQTPGIVNLSNGTVAFNIADPNATLTVSAQISNGTLTKSGPGTLVLNGIDSVSGTVSITAGTLTIGPNALLPNNNPLSVAAGTTLNIETSIPNDSITNNGTVLFPAGTGITPNVVQIGSLSIPSGTTSTIAAAANHSGRTLLVATAITLAQSGSNATSTLNLTSNDLDITTPGSFAAAYAEVKHAYANGTWTGQGITSSTAASDTTHLTALGIIQNNQNGSALFTASNPFDGTTPGAGDTLIKYTYYGDANLDGSVNGSDYTRIDNGFSQKLTGWFNGDFNYDGVVDGSDYALTDNSFNTQGAQLSDEVSQTVQIAAEIAGPSAAAAVPEPSGLILLGGAAAALLGRRRRTSVNVLK